MTTEAANPSASRRARPTIPAARYGERLARAAALAGEHKVAALLIGFGANLRYLTGYAAPETERLTMLVLRPAGRPILLVPRLEAPRAGGSPAVSEELVEIATWEETEDPHTRIPSIVDAGLSGDGAYEVAVSDRLWASHVLALQAALGGAAAGRDVRFDVASKLLRTLRMAKDDDEVALLRLAAQAADRVVEQIARGRLVGRTEHDVSQEVRDRLIAEGHDDAEFAIVASGPNSASPHHEASDREIQAGEPIVLDIGGVLGGYCSDTTRTLWVTGGDSTRGPDDGFVRLFGLVRDAQARATAAVHPGVGAAELDGIARSTIGEGGYGERFIHRLGHGIGLEGHEEPYLVAGNDERLRAGMTFSIEPGIYIEGRYGARLEDIVVCGPDGPVVLNNSQRELYVVDG